jgi:hypothetical protein
MFTDIIHQFDHIANRINDAELLLDPWPHLYISEIFSPDYYRQISEFEKFEGFEAEECFGRTEYRLVQHSKEYEEFTCELFSLLASKFNYVCETRVPATTNFWVDTEHLQINDIHVDAFYDTEFTISGQIYLPKDVNQQHYGTSLYTYLGDNIHADAVQDEGTSHPHTVLPEKEHMFKLVRRVPFYPNCMLVTTNQEHSWHKAPNIDSGDIRKSMMMRWKV